MLVELSPPSAGPDELAELATHLRLPTGFEADPAAAAALTQAMVAALALVERHYGRALRQRGFRAAARVWDGGVALPMVPAKRLTALSIEAEDGTRTSCAAEDYRLDPLTTPPRVTLRPGRPAPVSPDGGMILVDFDAGYGPAWGDAPADLRMAVLLTAAGFYEAGGDPRGNEPPLAAEALLAPYRRVRP